MTCSFCGGTGDHPMSDPDDTVPCPACDGPDCWRCGGRRIVTIEHCTASSPETCCGYCPPGDDVPCPECAA